ncbi:cysteine synthase A [Pasteurella skyensis]|uniref:Cysteine synthase n=1 Tax=Phocoenobacter skyensis TaxID=97481 RepID=A0AAJ6N8G5_9PAST|nr:cysteine synthase A [Pasteurella skyensis]MDP8161993.1 cysteine synthase A [Pasteurella skyensis]MDP8172149.1 cysteine synthase A [Pasteurella skyensis]MDP8176503.1 cysteine synthase A [Pasteurella skyensis]MDP8178391.1 cysteine synthase A [Pasteurella skyensis]MDP8182853.1 cysteine synthase A [Pasteurella skyensis]
MKIYDDNSLTIGNTPLIRLKHFGYNGNILVKVESRNPSFSVKCRVGANMVWQAEKDGILTSEKEIIDATSGNTGVALAYVAAARGYKLTLTMPETMSLERKKLLKGLGVNLVLTEGALGMKGAIAKADEILANNPTNYVMLRQFDNPANPDIHYKTTAPEIWEATQGEFDMIVVGVGTGGTITGLSRYFKEKRETILSVAVEPAESPVITQRLNNQDIQPAPHKIQGIGAGFIPKNLDLTLIDRVEQVGSETAIETARQLMAKEGLLVGISSGAAVAVADRLAKLPEFKNKVIVTVLPSASERYLSTALFDGIEV